jgi:alpha-L-fucosidase 2
MQRNFGPNLFSLYDAGDVDPIFQIDANLGYPGAVIVRCFHVPCCK